MTHQAEIAPPVNLLASKDSEPYKRKRGNSFGRHALPDLPAREADLVGVRKLFAQRALQLRRRAGLSQAAVARRAGMASYRISKLENGETNPSLETIERIAAALGVEIPELFRPTRHKNPA